MALELDPTVIRGTNEAGEDDESRSNDRSERAMLRTRWLVTVWWFQTILLAGSVVLLMAMLAIESKGYFLSPIILGLMFVGLLSSAWRALCGVLRSRSYPGRHWRKTQGCLPTVILITLVLGTLIGSLVITVREFAPIAAALAGGVLLYLMIILTCGVSESYHHVRVTPYFRSKVHEIDTYCNGRYLARHVLELDELARSLRVIPLSDYGWNDDFASEPLIWHDSAGGLKTVNTLLAHLQGDEFPRREQFGVVDDLKRISQALTRADSRGIDFCFLLQHGNFTNAMEHDQRKGTFF